MILSLCPNPCLDVWYSLSAFKEDDVTRVGNPVLSPGGKGVNSARVIARFCEDSYLVLPLGGCVGRCIKEMLEGEGVTCIMVEVSSPTRVNAILEQRGKGTHILLASKGSPLKESEVKRLLTAVCADLEPSFLILGGSVPPELPDTFYADIIKSYRGTKTKIVVDADGELLRKAVSAGPYLIKPNVHELERLVGAPLLTLDEIVQASREIIEKGVEVVVVSLGSYGAVCVTKERAFRVIPPKVEVKSTVGAGDSLVGGMVYALYSGMDLESAVRFGVACGTATVVEEGTRLCAPEKVSAFLPSVKAREIK